MRSILEHTASPSFPEGLALLACGSFGLRWVCPGSDVDLALIHRDGLSPNEMREIEDFTSAFVAALYDRGIEVGSRSLLSIDHAVHLGRQDFRMLTTLLTTRCLAGDSAVLPEFHRARMRTLPEYLAAYLQWRQYQRTTRHAAARMEQADEEEAPDLKRGRGGLRDAQEVIWLARIHDLESVDALSEKGWLSQDAVRRYWRAVDDLLRIRFALHGAAHGSRAWVDILKPDVQSEVASQLGMKGGRQALLRRLLSARLAIMAALEILDSNAKTVADWPTGRCDLDRFGGRSEEAAHLPAPLVPPVQTGDAAGASRCPARVA